jgi:hypothetical protein
VSYTEKRRRLSEQTKEKIVPRDGLCLQVLVFTHVVKRLRYKRHQLFFGQKSILVGVNRFKNVLEHLGICFALQQLDKFVSHL